MEGTIAVSQAAAKFDSVVDGACEGFLQAVENVMARRNFPCKYFLKTTCT